jgi:lipoyl-dependent peroxiredoxin
MPRITRTAEVAWEGNLARGTGTLDATTGAFGGLPYSLASRIAEPEGKTSPEELLAAAHGACFTMSLAGELTKLDHPPGRLATVCEIVMDEVPGQGHQIVGSNVSVRAQVTDLDDATFAEAVTLADEGCPFSALLKRSGATVTIAAELAS